MRRNRLLAMALPLLMAQAATARTIYVNASATGSHTGFTWATAYDNLQSALSVAISGDSIFVAKGLYTPSAIAGGGSDPRDKTFLLKDNVVIFGGMSGAEFSLHDRDSTNMLGSNASILSGELGIADSSDNAYHVVTNVHSTSRTMLDGFIITRGNASGTGSIAVSGISVSRAFGGGMYYDSSILAVVRHVIVKENYAAGGGAGMNNEKNTSLDLKYSTFINNRVYGSDPDAGGGGAIRNDNSLMTAYAVDFTTNSAFSVQGGGALRNEKSYVALVQSTFLANHSEDGDGGGAVYNADSSDGEFTNVNFQSNTTANQAGGMYNDNSRPILRSVNFTANSGGDGTGAMENDGGSDAVLINVVFNGNYTDADAGAMQNWKSSPELYNVSFIGNRSKGDGGAIYNYTDCSPKISNCLFRENYTLNNGGAIFNKRNSNPVLVNCVLYKNQADMNGGGIYNVANSAVGALPSSPVLTNVTIVRNSAGVSGGGGFDDGFGTTLLRNSIISGNHAPGIEDVDAPLTLVATALFHSIITDQYFETGLTTPVSVTGDIFVDTLYNDYRLAAGSAAIDMGDSNYYAAGATPDISIFTTDYRGADRIMGDNIDLGAYETCNDTLHPVLTFTTTPGTTVTAGTSVTFTASLPGAGPAPVFYWMKNGVVVSGTNPYVAVAGTDFVSGDMISIKALPMATDICTNNDTARSTPVTMTISTGLTNMVLTAANIHIIPNPNSGMFQLETGLAAGTPYTVAVTDITGRELYRNEFAANTGNRQSIGLGNGLQPGIYFLSVSDKSGARQTIRFTIQ